MKKGLLIILSGPSGVGKGTVRKQIQRCNEIDFVYSISMTTRAKRDKETDGVEYYFVTPEEFQRNIDNDNFLEWAEFVGNRYGTPKDKVEELRNQGKNVFLEIEITGATQVLSKVKDDRVISFFLMPPSLEALEDRIRKRKSETEEVIQKRLAKGAREMKMSKQYDHVIMNENVVRAAHSIINLIKRKERETK